MHSQNDPITGGKQKGKKKGKDDDFTWDWDKERLRAVTLLYNLLQLKLSMLFDPPTVEEEVDSSCSLTLWLSLCSLCSLAV